MYVDNKECLTKTLIFNITLEHVYRQTWVNNARGFLAIYRSYRYTAIYIKGRIPGGKTL